MPERPAQLEHLTGVRFFLALWIVCGHYMPSSPNDKGFGITCRSFAAVNFFVVMSGFVTHLAYGQRLASGMKLKTFYLRRMSQIVITTYVAMIASLVVVVVIPEYRNSFMPSFATILGCFAFIMHWIRPATWCPAPPSWTVEALIPCWLLYPLLRRLVETLDRVGGMALMSSMLLLYGVSFGPLLSLYFLQDGHLTWGQFATSFMWPPSQLGDFALGIVTAQLWGRWRVPSILGDVVLVALLLVLVMLPSPSSRSECQNDGNALLSHATSLAIAIFILASPKPSVKPCGLTRLLSHPALVALGKYSFEVYLFQWPLQAIFRQLCQRWPTPETFMAFLLLLWFISGLYVEVLVMPLTHFCRSQTSSAISGDTKGNLQSEQS